MSHYRWQIQLPDILNTKHDISLMDIAKKTVYYWPAKYRVHRNNFSWRSVKFILLSSICSLERDLWDIKKFGSSCKEGGNEDSATLCGPFVHRLSKHTEALSVRLMKIVCNCFLITKRNGPMNCQVECCRV